MKHFKDILSLILLLMVFGNVYAYKVYPSTGHKCKTQLLDLSTYSYVQKHADGLWMMPWNFRANYFTNDDFQIILSSFSSKQMVAEINDTHVKWGSNSPHPVQLTNVLSVGAKIHTIMAYNEGVNGSLLTAENIRKFKTLYGSDYLLISNVRKWDAATASVFEKLDGISFEFQVPEKNDGIWLQVVEAIKWAHKYNKYIYLLSPSGHNNYNLNRGYINGYMDLFSFLQKHLGNEILKSDKLIFAPANYNIEKTNIQMTPETEVVNGDTVNANTVMGVAKWLLEQPLYAK